MTYVPNVFEVGSRPFSGAKGDFNNDSNFDLDVTNLDSDTVSILLGNGDGTFGNSTAFAAGDEPFE